MKKYAILGFKHMYSALKKNSKEYSLNFFFPKPSFWDVITNYFYYQKLQREGKLKKYGIIHLNNWEIFLNYKKENKQIGIGESHGFHVGLNFEQTLKQIPFPMKQLNILIKLFFTKRIRKKIKEFDIFYVSTPNMLKHAKKIRSDAKWLPNPIETDIYNPRGKKIRLKGDPSIFLPTKFHAAKNIDFAMKLFGKIKKKYPKACLHYINYDIKNSPLRRNYLVEMSDKKTFIKHEIMNAHKLAIMYRSADFVLGHFNTDLACLCLIELEAMACKAPIIYVDKYETNININDAEKLTFKILEDKEFRKKRIEENYKYVVSTHSGESTVKIINSDIAEVLKKRKT